MSGEKFEKYEKELRRLEGVDVKVSGSSTVTVGHIVIRVSGSGRVSEEEIRISGSGRIVGSIRIDRIRASGSFSCDGDLEVDELRTSGSCSITGTVKGGSLRASGSCRVGQDLRVSIVQTSGSLSVGGNVIGEYVKTSGSFRAENVNVTDCEVYGSFKLKRVGCKGTFKAEMSGSCVVEEGIRARDVYIRRALKGRGEGFRLVLFNITLVEVGRGGIRREGELKTKYIEAENTVYIENTECDIVRGRIVTIGPKCTIRKKLEYVESYNIDPTSKVLGEVTKVGETPSTSET